MAFSSTITNLIVDLGDQEPILLKDTSTETLQKVITWCQHQSQNPMPPRGEAFELTHWENEFFNVKQELLLAIVLAGSDLGIESLVVAGRKAVEDLMKRMM